MRAMALVVLGAMMAASAGCAKSPPPSEPASAASGAATSGAAASAASGAGAEAGAGASGGASGAGAEAGATACGSGCYRFSSNEAAFRWVLSFEPTIFAIGEAHAQKGSEGVASATRRFTETMLPLLENRASDLLVEAWAGDPRCQREVKQVASAQKPVQQAQAQTNPNEYLTLGTRARALGVIPDLLRPSCEDFASLADAGADSITASLGLIKRLTLRDATRLFQRNQAARNGKMVVTYGGAMHNDLAPSEPLRAFSFGPELFALAEGRYVELDLIVPEYVKKNEVWQKLPWYAAWEADPGPRDRPTVYRVGERSFVLLFAMSGAANGAANGAALTR